MKGKLPYIIIGLGVLVVALGLIMRSQNLGPLGMASDQATPLFSNQAIGGYDAVAYFTENAAVPGTESFQQEWNGALWNFKSAENLALFKESPEKYAPQYGGHCAQGTSDGIAAGGDPTVWTIVEGKLYFNLNEGVRKEWREAAADLIVKADQEWANR